MSLVDYAVAAFRDRFGSSPTVGARAPGRVNLIGEHTDYNDGFVLPAAINRSAVIVGSPAETDRSILVASDLNAEIEIDLTQPLQPVPRGGDGAFANYILGVVDQFARLGWEIPNLNLVAHGDVPIGAGLSSSAAIEVATATLLEQVLSSELDPVDKALLCQRAEHVFPGTPCGVMDMFISVMAQHDRALLIDCRSNEARPIEMPPADEMALLIFDTGVQHDLAEGAYAERRAACEAVAAILGVRALRDATLGMIDEAHRDGRIDERHRNRAAHVVLENVRTLLAAEALHERRIEAFCNQMFESHKSLRNLYEVSCPELDLIVDTAHQLRDEIDEPHLGARMTGGGFGGCAIVYTASEHQDAVKAVIGKRFADAFDRVPGVFITGASDGACAVQVEIG